MELAPLTLPEILWRFALAVAILAPIVVFLGFVFARLTGGATRLSALRAVAAHHGQCGRPLIATAGYVLLWLLVSDQMLMNVAFVVTGALLMVWSYRLPRRLSFTKSPRFAGVTVPAQFALGFLHTLVVGVSVAAFCGGRVVREEKNVVCMHGILEAGVVSIIVPIIIALAYISLVSLFREPNRRNFNAIMIAGAGAAYLNGGFGVWEFAFLAVVTYLAYMGLRSYLFIGVGWLLHTGWDVLHHLYGNDIVPFAEGSSFGCAICDPVIALWCFAGAPSVYGLLRRKQRERADSGA